MTDARERELERRHAAGDLGAGAELSRLRRRRGAGGERELELASLHGDRAAARALGVTDSLDRIERWLQRHHPALLATLARPAEPGALREVEVALGHPLPGALAELYLWRDGQEPGPQGHAGGFYEVDPLEREWRLLRSAELAPARVALAALADEGFPAATLLPVLRCDPRPEPAPERAAGPAADGSGAASHPDPALRVVAGPAADAGASFVCVDLQGSCSGRPGQVVLLRPEEGLELLFPSLERWLATYAASLEADQWRAPPPDALGAQPGLARRPTYEAFVEQHNPGYPRPVDLDTRLTETGCCALLLIALVTFLVQQLLQTGLAGRAVCGAFLCLFLLAALIAQLRRLRELLRRRRAARR